MADYFEDVVSVGPDPVYASDFKEEIFWFLSVNSKILFCRVHVREGSGLWQPQVPGSNLKFHVQTTSPPGYFDCGAAGLVRELGVAGFRVQESRVPKSEEESSGRMAWPKKRNALKVQGGPGNGRNFGLCARKTSCRRTFAQRPQG